MARCFRYSLALVLTASLAFAFVLAPAAAEGEKPIPVDYFYSFAPLPAQFEKADNPITDAKVKLGRMLYFEQRLSKNHDVACSTCHPLDDFGMDGSRVSTGHLDQVGTRNSPSVYNAAGLVAQFWDGRSRDVEEQAGEPILNPVEMAMPDEARVVATLRTIPGYVEEFARAFPGEAEPLTYANLERAIGAFERLLVTPSRFDEYVGGKRDALSADEELGFRRFVELGCAACHNGPTVGGSTFEMLGLIEPYPDQSDLGRYDVTKKDADRMLFRTPGLRNVAKTAPYFHDGKVAELRTAIELMGRHQLGLTIEAGDIALLTAFLGALTGKLPPEELIEEPELPESGPDTPPPDKTPTPEVKK